MIMGKIITVLILIRTVELRLKNTKYNYVHITQIKGYTN